MENMELNPNEMEGVVGGTKIHYKPEKDIPGWIQHQVVRGETLIRIANKYNIKNWKLILDWNPHINPETNMIIAGEYLWIRKM